MADSPPAAPPIDLTQFPTPSTLGPVGDEPFKVVSDFAPAGDQPAAIEQLSPKESCAATGSRRCSASPARASQPPSPGRSSRCSVRRLILAPNKSLAAQLAQEMREFFPNNRVEYFVSYYDYYQPEAYIPSSDTYIEKDSSINDEIDRLRHSATAGLLTRRDVIVVASVSCIYGMGNPDEYRGQLVDLSAGVDYDMRSILRRLVNLQYDRNDMTLGRGKFRVRGDTIEVHPAYEESVLRIEMFGDTVDRITMLDPLTGETLGELNRTQIFPATHYVAGRERMATGDGQHRGRAARAACLVRAAKESCWKRSACGCAPSTTWR